MPKPDIGTVVILSPYRLPDELFGHLSFLAERKTFLHSQPRSSSSSCPLNQCVHAYATAEAKYNMPLP